MATTKITEKQTTSSVKNAASFLITQQENDTESLRRASMAAVVAALKANGINDGTVLTSVLEAMYPNLVKSITPGTGKITVKYWDDEEQDITVESGGLAFDSVTYDQSTGYLHIQQGGVDVVDPCFIGGGGGGGSSGSTITITNRMASRTITILESATSCNILFTATSVDSQTQVPTGPLTANWYVNGTRVKITSMAQGQGSFDCKPYLTSGSTDTVKLVIEDSYGGSKSLQWSVTTASYSLTWNLDEFANHGTDALNIRVTPSGVGTKTVKVSLDGAEIFEQETESSGRAIAVTVPAQSHGAHTILAWVEATIDGQVVTSEPVRHIGMWVSSQSTTPIIAIERTTATIAQYGTLTIKYRVYDPSAEPASIIVTTAGTQTALSVGRETQTVSYRPMTSGNKTISITCGSVSVVCNVTVTASEYDINPVTRGLILDLDPTGHTNQDDDRDTFGYKDGDGTNHPLSFSSNFDWVSGGFQKDSDNITAFVVKRGTYVDLDRSLFNDEAKTSGKEIKIVFKVTECRDYDAQLLSCYANNIGLRLQAQQATLSSSLQTATVQYCEEAKIEMDVNIEATTEDQLAVIWLKGIPSRGVAYSGTDTWQQTNPQLVRIGSDDCDVWIYRMKMYSTSLTRFEILDNFTADCSDTGEMIERYERNNIFNANGTINETKLSEVRPELRVIHITAEKMTVSKKDEVPCSVTLKYVNGGAEYDFTATGVTMKAQGTSSLEYILAALNLDLDFKNATSWVDGNENPITGYALTPNSIPVNYINIKLNVASSENANNAMGVDDYNLFQPYLNAARKQNPKVRDTCEGHPCALFFTNSKNEAIEVGARIVGPGETILYGCGDIINSKKNYAVFGQDTSEYPYQSCVEITNNNNLQARFKSDDLSTENWGESDEGVNNFEFRYPKSPTSENKADWQAVLSWVVSTDRDAATGDALPEAVTYGGVTYTTDTAEYRGAKFKAELADHFSVDSLLYHYLFTERECMVDNRAKNTFMSFEVENYEDRNDKTKYRWNICKNYDDDTMQGNDNSGGLTFTYGLEDTDTVDGQKVFNASDSVLWVNIRDLMQTELKAMFLNREAAGAWSATRILEKWKAHQSARPEALCVEDMWGKYFTPFINKGETKYIDMMLGTKEYQRQQFQTYQEKYMSSKYGGSVSTTDRITLRPQTSEEDSSGDLSDIVPYASVYITVKYGEAYTSHFRAQRGQSYSVTVPAGTSISDLETYIYSASMLKTVGSLAKLYTKKAEMTTAVKLQEAVIGSDEEGYSNVSLTTLSLGQNILLEKIDLRGTPNLAQSLDLSALKALQEIYTEGSGVTGITFAQRSPVTTASLNALRQLIARDLTSLETFEMPYTELQTVWIENCPLIDTKALVTGATNLSRGRLINVDWSLDRADLLIRLSRLAGIDGEGRNIDTFVLTGSAYVAHIGMKDKTTIEAKFPNLTLTYGEIYPTFTVRFKNYDGTVLDTQSVDQGSAPSNPVTRQEYPIDTPTRQMTAQSVFTFDGWSWENGGTLIDDIESVSIIADNTVIWAHYSVQTRYYDVKFFNGTSQIGDTIHATYGSEVVYSGEIPRNPSDGEYATYYLFKGWDKSTGYVTENMNVNALYDSCVRPTDKTLSQMAPEELHALIEEGILSPTGANNDMIFSGDEFDLMMGNDFYFTNISAHDLIPVTAPITFDGETVVKPQINGEYVKLFDADKSWTLAIDFAFDTTAETNSVLASCFHANGFVLKYSAGGQVRYGNSATAQVSSNGVRQITVLRHKAGDPNLYVYASNKNGDAISYTTLNLSETPIHNAVLSFGAQTYVEGDSDNYSKGTVYWAKLWDGDLGDDNCRTLSAWPRQTFTMQAVGSSDHAFKTFLRQDNARYCNCSFMMKNLMEETHWQNTTDSNVGGWKAMPIRTWLNNRIVKGLPIKWQQLLLTVAVNTTEGNNLSTLVDPPAYDKIWMPACKDVGVNASTSPYSIEAESTFTIYTNDASRVKKLNNGSGSASTWWLRSAHTGSTNFFLYVFTSGAGTNYNIATLKFGVAWGFCI